MVEIGKKLIIPQQAAPTPVVIAIISIVLVHVDVVVVTVAVKRVAGFMIGLVRSETEIAIAVQALACFFTLSKVEE